MNFRPELAAKVMAGEKTQTRRLVSHNPRSPWWHVECGYKVGRDYAVCPGRGKHAIGRIRITETMQLRLGGTLSLADAQAEGFASRDEFRLAWIDINGGYDSHAMVWIVKFEVAA